MLPRIITAICLSVLILAVSARADRPAPKPIDIPIDQIGREVRLIGRLGHPLGEMMTVEGSWGGPKGLEKESSLRFFVSSVDGKPLENPVEFYVERVNARNKSGAKVTPASGDRWTMHAFETGDYFGAVPKKYTDELHKPEQAASQAPAWHWQFSAKLIGILQSGEKTTAVQK